MRPKLEDKALLLAKCLYCTYFLFYYVVNEQEVRLVGKSYNRLLRKFGCVSPLVVLDSKIAPNPVHNLFCLIFCILLFVYDNIAEFTYQDYFWYIVSVTYLPAEHLIKLLLSACDILTTIPITRVNLMLFFLKIGLNIVPSDVESVLADIGKKDEKLFTFDDFLHIYEIHSDLFLQLQRLKESFISNIFGQSIYKHIQIRLKNIKYILHYNEQYNSFPSDPCMWKMCSFIAHKPPINKYDYCITSSNKRTKTIESLITYFSSLYRKTQVSSKSTGHLNSTKNNNKYIMHKTSIEYIHNGKIIHKRCSSACDLDNYSNNLMDQNNLYYRKTKNASVPRSNRSLTTTTSSPLFIKNSTNINIIPGSFNYNYNDVEESPTYASIMGGGGNGNGNGNGFINYNTNINNMTSPRKRSSFHNDQVDMNDIVIPGLIE